MTPPRSNAEQFLRTLSILAWFRSHPDSSLMAASRALDLSTAQIAHELGQVSQCRVPASILDMPVEITVDRMRATVEFSAGLDRPLALTAMEEPITFDAQQLRAEKAKVLAAVTLPEDISAGSALGQYEAGLQGGRAVSGFLQEKDIPPDSRTETFAALKLGIDTRRWAGVPFYLRAG